MQDVKPLNRYMVKSVNGGSGESINIFLRFNFVTL